MSGQSDIQVNRINKAISSACIPGLGQIEDKRTGKGIAYMAGTLGSAVACGTLIGKYNSDVFEASAKVSGEIPQKVLKIKLMDLITKKAPEGIKKGRLYIGLAFGVLTAGLWIANIVDAYKGGKRTDLIKKG